MPGDVSFSVRVLLFRESDMWVAQCLEFDIAAQGRNLDEVQSRLHRTFIGQVVLDMEMGKKPLADVAKAPAWYWKSFENSPHRLQGPTTFSVEDLPPAYVVHAVAEEAICA